MREIVKSLPPTNDPLFETQICGTSYCDNGYKLNIYNEDVYRFEYIISGSMSVTVNGKKEHLNMCDVLFIPRKCKALYTCDGDTCSRVWVCVKGALIDSLVEIYGLNGTYIYENCRIFDLFNEITRNVENSEDRSATEQSNAVILHKIIQSAYGCLKLNGFTPDDAQMLRDYIDANYSKPINNGELARIIGKSESQTIRIFKKSFNVTPYNYALDRKIQVAERMLVTTQMSVRNISMALGFKSEHYFSSCFKEKTGIPPLQYRKKHI